MKNYLIMNKKNKKLDFSKCINTRIINTLSKKDNKYIVVDEDGNEVDVRETIVPEMFAEEAKVVKDEDKKEN